MKDLLRKIPIPDKSITAACRTPAGIEWTTLRIKQDGTKTSVYKSLSLELPADATIQDLADVELPDNLSEAVAGEVTVALRSSELLMRTMTFPTSDPREIADMVGFQIDKVSPFPMDQLATSHEILSTTEDSALVLIVAAKRARIDAIGDTFEAKGVRIHSIDARVLGWLQLISDAEELPESECSLLLIVDGMDLVLVVLSNGLPIVFRSLDARFEDMDVVDELAEEINYTLTTLDAEYDFPNVGMLDIWSIEALPEALQAKLSERCGLRIETNGLDQLPPLSEGLIRRTLSEKTRVELIPAEWVDHQKRLKLRKQFLIASGSIGSIWLSVMLVFLMVFWVRDMKLNSAKADAAAIAPAAKTAEDNQSKLRQLKESSDRSDSSLECLLEVTRLLPPGDIEFLSYNYKKGDGVSLRGTANNDTIVNEFFRALAESQLLFLEDQSFSTTTKGGVRRTVFTVKLKLPGKEMKP